MKYILLFAIIWCIAPAATVAQTFKSENQMLYFSSEAALDNFEAASDKASFLFDSNTLQLKLEVAIESFEYDASLKQSSLGGDFLNITENPVAVFEGVISGVERKNGPQIGLLSGKWFLGGKEVEAACEVPFTFGQGVVKLKGAFELNTADFAFELPEDLEFYVSDICTVTFETEMQIVNQ